MEKTLFIIGDVHGEYELLERLLQFWDTQTQQLVFLGDLADRGPKSKQCWLKVRELVENHQAICLMGNHEDIFLQWLDAPSEKFDWYMRNGGEATINSLLYAGVLLEESIETVAAQIRYMYKDLIAFIRQLPLYCEFEHIVCVHAGLNLQLENWRDTSKRDCLWIRENFHTAQQHIGKTVVFGHTPVQNLYDNHKMIQPWFSYGKIGVDGGAVYGGALMGVVIEQDTVTQIHQVLNRHVCRLHDSLDL